MTFDSGLDVLQRFMDELAIMKPPEPTKSDGPLILEQVPVLRDGLARGVEWAAVARHCLETVFAKAQSPGDRGPELRGKPRRGEARRDGRGVGRREEEDDAEKEKEGGGGGRSSVKSRTINTVEEKEIWVGPKSCPRGVLEPLSRS